MAHPELASERTSTIRPVDSALTVMKKAVMRCDVRMDVMSVLPFFKLDSAPGFAIDVPVFPVAAQFGNLMK